MSARTTTTATTRVPARADAAPAHDAVAELMAHWRHDGTTFVVVDERGRHRGELGAGRLDLTHAPVVDSRWIDATLHRAGYVLLDACNLPRRARRVTLARALAAVRGLRDRSGQPEWVLLEDAQDLLREPGLSPQAFGLAAGGYCLAVRGDGSLPAWARSVAGLEVRVTQPGLELSLLPPASARH